MDPISNQPDAPPSERLAIEFLERLASDRAAGEARSLASYLAEFPGHEERIVEEWLAASGRSRPPAGGAQGRGDEDASAARDDEIGPYRLVRELGRGGQGVVHLAEDRRVGRQVALKVLAGDVRSVAGQAAARFAREAEALARLEHPGIATVYEVGADRGRTFLAMRYVAGGSVAQRIAARMAAGVGPPRGRDEVAAVVRLVERAARALDAAHRAGILHRDVKPANLLLQGEDEPVLVDFGLASDASSAAPTITLPGAVLGTLGYLPPERLLGRAADARSDVWGLGAVLWELLAHERPFAAPTTAAELKAIAERPLGDLRAKNPAVPRDLAVCAATALARDPAERYQSAAAFAEDLARVAARQPILARPAGPLVRALRFVEREPGLALALGSLLLVLVAGLVTTTWLWRSERKALHDVARLADLKLVRELRQREESLWPARPERAEAMRAWTAEAEELAERSAGHAATLAALPAGGGDRAVAWQREQLELLVREAQELASRVPSVRQRLHAATTLAEATLVRCAAAWHAARKRIAHSQRYGGLDLRPQLGLVPLGPDPTSGLEEFAHASSGAVLERDPGSGRLAAAEAGAIVLVLVPGGRAVLGAERAPPADGRPHNLDPQADTGWTPSYVVELEPFFLAKWEMTQAQWLRHTGVNPSVFHPGATVRPAPTLLHPVELVSFEDCERVLQRLDLDVPTEAQWEWACRAGTHGAFAYGGEPQCLAGHENLADLASKRHDARWPTLDWLDDGFHVHAPVGSFAPNGFGLHDMGGNVKEWCADSWEDYTAVAPRAGDGLRRGAFERYRIIRGGCYRSTEADARAACRIGVDKTEKGSEAGIRPARRVER